MNVLIVTEGGKNIGFGHITRCVSIYQAFEEFGIVPRLIVNGDESIHDFVKDKNCEIFNWLNNREKLFSTLKDANVFFIDSYLAEDNLYKKTSTCSGVSVYLDDNIRVEYPRGFVLNGGILAEQMPYPKKKGLKYLLGTQYTPIRKDFWEIPAKPIRDKVEVIMVTFGGEDTCNLTPKVLKLLVENYPELTKKAIIGKGLQNTTELETIKDSNTALIYYPDSCEMKKIMLESDIAITAGGQTLYELARIGVPTIAVCTADNQLRNIQSWQKANFIEYAGEWEDRLLINVIQQKIGLLKSKSIRKDKQHTGNNLIDGKGSIRIVKEILFDSYNNNLILRQATFEDARDIFELANNDVVRKNSFNRGKIEWENHLKWLKEKLADSNCLFFIIDHMGSFVGQVRFDMIPQEGETVINISLCKNFRGLGLSPLVINKSIEKLSNMSKDLKLIRAYIKKKNTPSVKAFVKAGFNFLEDIMINKCPAGVYEMRLSNE